MLYNHPFFSNLAEKASAKVDEMHIMAVANRIYKLQKMRNMNLADAMKTVLEGDPKYADNPIRKGTASAEDIADQLHDGVSQFYMDLDEKTDSTWVKNKLGSAMDGLSSSKQGEYLVKLIQSCGNLGDDARKYLADHADWNHLEGMTDFSAEQVQQLLDIADDVLNMGAGFMQSQAFRVMESHWDKVSDADWNELLGSGREYADAYAAALYICEDSGLAPEQLGLTAASSVEGCGLLAQYRFSKHSFEELKARFIRNAKAFLTKMAAHTLRKGVGLLFTIIGFATFVYLGIKSLGVLVTVALLCYMIGFVSLTQDEAVDIIKESMALVRRVLHLMYQNLLGEPEATDITSSQVKNATPIARPKANYAHE